jgi:hypothetical protein
MPQRTHVVPVACESCRKRKTRVRSTHASLRDVIKNTHTLQCDGATPVCSSCRNRVAQCVYSSSPGMSRLVALKSEHKQLESSHDNLMRLYRRLKQGSASEVSAIIKRIKSSDEILDISEHEGRLPQSLEYAQLANNAPGLVDQNAKSRTSSSALLGRDTFLALDQTPESTSSFPCASRHANSTGLPSGKYDNGCPGDAPTTKRHVTSRRAFYTNAEHESAVGFSLEYEPLLRGLLSSNIAGIRQGFLVLRSWNVEIRKIHDTEQSDSLFSVLCHGEDIYIPRSRLCEMCAVAAISGQFVRHLLAAGLINYWYGKLHLEVLVSRRGQL